MQKCKNKQSIKRKQKFSTKYSQMNFKQNEQQKQNNNNNKTTTTITTTTTTQYNYLNIPVSPPHLPYKILF